MVVTAVLTYFVVFWGEWPQVHVEESRVGQMIRNHRKAINNFFGKKTQVWNVESYENNRS